MLRELRPPTDVPADVETPQLGEPGVLEDLVQSAGLRGVLESAGEAAVRQTIAEAAAPFRRANGSYRFEDTFRYLIARA